MIRYKGQDQTEGQENQLRDINSTGGSSIVSRDGGGGSGGGGSSAGKSTLIKKGCMDKSATNFDPNATVADNASCVFATNEEGPLSESPNITVIVKSNKESQILIDGVDSQQRTAGTYHYSAKELLSGKTFTGSSSKDAYVTLYPKVAKTLLSGQKVTITYTDIETGK